MEQEENSLAAAAAMPRPAQYVWIDERGQGRNHYARFRLSFILDEAPVEAQFHLFADTSYQMFVNGEYVGFGPGRSGSLSLYW